MANIKEIVELLDGLINATTIPKNIRRTLDEAKKRLEGNEETSVKVSAAIYLIESITDDVNMPPHARTQIWAILSNLESIKG